MRFLPNFLFMFNKKSLAGIAVLFMAMFFCGSVVSVSDATEKSRKSDLQRIQELLARDKAAIWLFAGDSITHGVAANGWRDYVQLFELKLRWELLRKEHVVIKTAASGWIVASIDNRLEWYLEKFSPDVICMNFGMNDCVLSLSDPNAIGPWKKRYAKVINRIHAADIPIIIHTPNAMHSESQSSDVKRRVHLEEYVVAIRELAEDSGAVLIDNYKCWKDYQKKEAVKRWMSDDIHPNYYGHRVIAQEMFKKLGIYDPNSFSCRLAVPRYP